MSAATGAEQIAMSPGGPPGYPDARPPPAAFVIEAPPFPLFPLHSAIVREEFPDGVEEYAFHTERGGVCVECGTVLATPELYAGPGLRPDNAPGPTTLPLNTTTTWIGRRDASGSRVARAYSGPRAERLHRLNARRRDQIRLAFDTAAARLGSFGEEARRAEWLVRAAARAGLARFAPYSRLSRAAIVIAARERKRYVSLDQADDRVTGASEPPATRHGLTTGTLIARIQATLHLRPLHLSAVEVLRSVAARETWIGRDRRTVPAAAAIVARLESEKAWCTRQPAVMAAGAVYLAAQDTEGVPIKSGKTQPALARAFGVTEVSVRSATKELAEFARPREKPSVGNPRRERPGGEKGGG